MKSTDNVILSIAPATKRFGAVVFRDTELIHFAVKTLKPPRTNESIKREVSRSIEFLIKEFMPKVIVIKSPSKQQLKSIQFKLITDQIKIISEFNQIPLIRIKFEAVKKSLSFDRKPTKDSTFESLIAVYPELRQFTSNSSLLRKQYYDTLLIAASLGYQYQTEPSETRNQI